jgi:hypothetical protein
MRDVSLKTITKTLAALLLAVSCAKASAQEHKYSVAGIDDDRAVEAFLAELKEAVAKNDRAKVASMVNFPLRVNNDRRKTLVRRRADLLRRYDAVFNRKVKEALAKQTAADLFVNYQGVMVGDGEIWFRPTGKDGRLKIVTVNN